MPKTVAQYAVEACDISRGGEPREERLARLERLIREAMRDQRHACAEHVQTTLIEGGANLWAVAAAHAACMNTREPGA